MNRLLIFLALTALAACTADPSFDPVEYVNPFVGTDGHGHTYPGASMPFGMVQLSPDTRKDHWDGCSGYHYSDSTILGFSHTHLSGTGVGDYGDIRIVPMSGKVRTQPGDGKTPGEGYRSRFSHSNETASPGYYSVFLDDHQVKAELTVTNRCGLHRYRFEADDTSFILIDLTESVVTEKKPALFMEILNDREVRGYRKSSGWASDQWVFFHAVFSRPFISSGVSASGIIDQNLRKVTGNDIQAFFGFDAKESGEVMMKVGISAVDMEGALGNLQAELTGWDFDKVKIDAEEAWRKELKAIEVQDDNHDNKVKFYTALYHALLAPNLFSDADSRYRGHDEQIHRAEGFDRYTVFSLWDTYRALHPLMTIIQPERTNHFIRSFTGIYDEAGLLPVWELAGNETFCMIGYHAVPVIVDAYLKGIQDYDVEKAFEACSVSALNDHFGLKDFRELGYIPAEREGESVSKTLEYAYDDWCIAMMARNLEKQSDYEMFIKRAQNYKNIFDPETRFIRGKRNGMFVSPFDPAEVNFMLTEANTWQYTFYAPQDITGLMSLMGGEEAFRAKLDEMFSHDGELSGRQQADITGLIGQYAHGNEPSHHMAYLYNYAGNPDRTQELTREIMDRLYGSGPDGLCGNEDCGQMSAWFVFSAMGFYPVTPASGHYAIGSPLFEKVIIHLPDGNDFIIKTKSQGSDTRYIRSAELNGVFYDKSYILHEDIAGGGEISFELSPDKGSGWANGSESSPECAIDEFLITPVPYFASSSATFRDSCMISAGHLAKEARIFIEAEGKKPEPYEGPFYTYASGTFRAEAFVDGTGPSLPVRSSFFKIHNDWNIKIANPYNSQYSAGGETALIDGQRGGVNFRTGSWQGYYGVDLDVVIDLARASKIRRISASFLQDQKSWIFLPTEVEVSYSRDGTRFTPVAVKKAELADNHPDAEIRGFDFERIPEDSRYVRVLAKNRGVCPDWHVGAGQKAWIFVDEIEIITDL